MIVNLKENIKNILILVLIILLIVSGVYHYISKTVLDKKDAKIVENYNFQKVLNDSIKTYKDKNGELVLYKESFQSDLKTMKYNYQTMSDNQQKLYQEIKNNKNVITAMRDELNVKIDSLNNNKNYTISKDSTSVTFKDSSDVLLYNITVKGIKPIKPELEINNFDLPNNQIITHEWDNDGGVKINIKNSNPYFKVTDLDGYVIPQAKKEVLKPNKLKKIWNTTKKVCIGMGIGVLTVLILVAAGK